MIDYTNISYEKYKQLSDEKNKKPYCIEYPDGIKVWIVNGLYHRLILPAVEIPNGNKEWYLNGNRHRKDGPAIIYYNGYNEWCLNGKFYNFEEWCNKLNKTNEEIILLKLRYS